jgi:hypothetical protein
MQYWDYKHPMKITPLLVTLAVIMKRWWSQMAIIEMTPWL